MPIAKEVLKIGFTVVANVGTYVTKEAVAKYGWSDKVTDGPDIGGDKLDSAKPADEPAPATPKPKPKRGQAAS